MNIVPTEEIMVEATSPHSRWKPPLADTFAMFAALLMLGCPEGGIRCELEMLGRLRLSVLVFKLGDMLMRRWLGSDFFSLGFLSEK